MKHHHLYAGLIAELSSAVHSSSCVIAELTAELEEYRQPYDVGPASLAYEDFNDVETRQAGQEAMYIAGRESRDGEIAVLNSQIMNLRDRLSNAEGPDANAVEPHEPLLKAVKGAKLKAYKREIEELKEETEDLKAALERLKDQVGPINKTVIELKEEKAGWEKSAGHWLGEATRLKAKVQELERENDKLKATNDAKLATIHEQDAEIAELKESGGHAVQEANYQRGEAERLVLCINEICKAAHSLLDEIAEEWPDLLEPDNALRAKRDALVDAVNGANPTTCRQAQVYGRGSRPKPVEA